MLDFDLFKRVDRRGGPVARTDRLLQLRRSVPAQARGRDVRVHQVEVPAHLSLHEHERPGASPRSGRGGWFARGSTRSRSRSTAPRRRATCSTASAATLTRRSRTCARRSTRSAERPRRAVHQLALHPLHLERQRRGDGARAAAWRPTSASIGSAGRSPIIPENTFSRRFVPGTPSSKRIKFEIWDNNGLGNAIPGATPRADDRSPRTLMPGCAARRRGRGRPLHVRTRVRNLSTRPFPAHASYGRRLVRLGAQLCAADGTLHRSRLRARLAARTPSRPAARRTC